MSTTEKELQAILDDRRAEHREAEARTVEAATLGRKLENLRRELSQIEGRRDRCVELGDGRVTRAQNDYDPRYGAVTFAVSSAETGHQLARRAEDNLAEVRAQIETVEQQIAELVA